MQIKIFSIPIPGGEVLNEEMNAFLRSKKVLQVESHVVTSGGGTYWVFCVQYMEGGTVSLRNREKVDYKHVLDDAGFKRFARLREVRKQIAAEEAIPAFAVFKDEELAAMAQMKELTPAAMKKIKGIGARRVEKFGEQMIKAFADEKNERTDAGDH